MRTTLSLLFSMLAANPLWAIGSVESLGQMWEPNPDQMLMHRLSKILLNNSSRFVRPVTEPVVASTCVRAPTISDFIDSQAAITAAVQAPPLSRSTLKRSATNFKEIFALLRQTPTGRAVLAKFDPKFGFEIKVEQFSAAMKTGEKRRASALFDLERKTIFVDRKEVIGNLAPIFLHEIIHSLDKDYTRAVEREKELWGEFDNDLNTLLRLASRRKNKIIESLEENDFSKKEIDDIVRMKIAMEQFRDIRIYRAERVAYDFYFEVLKELAEQYPDFYLPNGRQMASLHPFADDQLVKIEGLSPTSITKYKKGLCKAFK